MCTCLTSCRAAPGPGNLTDFECNKRCLRYPHSAQCPRQVRTPEIYLQNSKHRSHVCVFAVSVLG